MVPNSIGEADVLLDLRSGNFVCGWCEGGVEVGYDSDLPVFGSVAVVIVCFGDVFIVLLIYEYGWWRHVFVARAHGAGGCVLDLWWFLCFCEVCWSACALCCYDDPAVEEVVFA